MEEAHDEHEQVEDIELLIMQLLLILFCVVCAGLAMGLTLGLSSMDKLSVKIINKCGEKIQQMQASKIEPLLTDRHYLLITLLIFNTIAQESLPIFVHKIWGSLASALISVTLILFFGQILPAIIFTGPHKWFLGQFFAPLVRFLFCLFYPLAKIMCIIMVQLTGHDVTVQYTRRELQTQVEVMNDDNKQASDEGKAVSTDETYIIKGVLESATTQVKDVMLLRQETFQLNASDAISREKRQELYINNHSRIPVQFNDGKVMQVLLKDFAVITDESLQVGLYPDLFLRTPHQTTPNTPILKLLKEMTDHSQHLAIVQEGRNSFLGIVTLEDLVERVLASEILDEKDLNSNKQLTRAELNKLQKERKDLDKGKISQERMNKKMSALNEQGMKYMHDYSVINESYIMDMSLNKSFDNVAKDLDKDNEKVK